MSSNPKHLSPLIGVRFEVVALAVIVCFVIFELVRRKRLMERYAILWLLAGAVVLVLGVWQGLLTTLSRAVGIYYPPSALFAVAVLFILIMLVHFSISISRLSRQNTLLAQRLALLQERLGQQPDQAADQTEPEGQDLSAGDDRSARADPSSSLPAQEISSRY
jgi:hypothetical protein